MAPGSVLPKHSPSFYFVQRAYYAGPIQLSCWKDGRYLLHKRWRAHLFFCQTYGNWRVARQTSRNGVGKTVSAASSKDYGNWNNQFHCRLKSSATYIPLYPSVLPSGADSFALTNPPASPSVAVRPRALTPPYQHTYLFPTATTASCHSGVTAHGNIPWSEARSTKLQAHIINNLLYVLDSTWKPVNVFLYKKRKELPWFLMYCYSKKSWIYCLNTYV